MLTHTLTSKQFQRLVDIFLVLIEVKENGSLRIVAGDLMITITPLAAAMSIDGVSI